MKETESFIRTRVRREIPTLMDEIKREVAKKVCDKVLKGMVNVQEGIEFDFYLKHFLVEDIKIIIDEEVASHMKNPPKVRKLHTKVKGAI
jgi:hypothetical protein